MSESQGCESLFAGERCAYGCGDPECVQGRKCILHEPDEMGVWDEGSDTIWLPRSRYPKRSQAIQWALHQWGCDWLDVRCRSRWMRYTPRVVEGYTLDGHTDPGWTEELWSECDKDEPNAFRVWRLESS